MLMISSLVLIVLLIFWFILIASYAIAEGPGVLTATPLEIETPRDADQRRQREEFWLRQDLRTIRITGQQAQQDALVELGVAENRTAVVEDERNELRGEVWLCDGRPLWFALLYQLTPSLLLAYVSEALFELPASIDAMIGVAAATLGWIVFSIWPFRFYNLAFMVQENTRMGVKRFGKQRNGYLQPGLQFILPGLEMQEDIAFQAFVWGPHTGDEADADFHINGVAGNMNPSPGLFKVLLRGRWMFDIVLQITVRFRKARKDAWWSALNRYRSFSEIGEQIAGTISTVLFTRTREIVKHEEELLKQEGINPEEPRAILQQLLAVINKIPEISGVILQTLQQLGYDRLGGVLPISVAIVSATPNEELQQLLQTEDEAQVMCYREDLAGQAVKSRWKHLRAAFGDPEVKAQDILRLDALEVQRQFAQAGGATNALEGLIRAAFASKVQEITGTGQTSQNSQSQPPETKEKK